MLAFALRLLLFSGSLSSIWATCGTRKSCCPGKNISCASFDWLPGRRGVLEWRRCFCDEFCVKSRDCCSDFKKICVQEKRDCIVSTWSAWSSCSRKCGVGTTTRQRTVVTAPRGAGRPCPALQERRTCVAHKCRAKKSLSYSRSAAARRLRERGRIIPLAFSKWRDHYDFSMKKDLRRHIFKQYHAGEEMATEPLCAYYKLNYAKPFCRSKGWAQRLHSGTKICVSCHPLTMNSIGSDRCIGLGDYQHSSRWKAVGISYCDGIWTRVSHVRTCECPSNSQDSYTFV